MAATERALLDRIGTSLELNAPTLTRFKCTGCGKEEISRHGLGWTWMTRMGWDIVGGLAKCGGCKRRYSNGEYVVICGGDPTALGVWKIAWLSRNRKEALVVKEHREWSGGPLPQFRGVKRAGHYVVTAEWKMVDTASFVGLARKR